jgi:large subunit ribosomal protein L32e
MVEKKAAPAAPKAAAKPAGKKIPHFTRQNRFKARVGDAWRKPRGIDNKLRMMRKGFSAIPRIGYGTPKAERGLHPSGVREVLVATIKELEAVQKGVAVRFSGTLGGRRRKILSEVAKKKGLKILN